MKQLNLTKPHAIIMVGLPGSGKSFFAQKFSDMFAAPYINSDLLIENSRDHEASNKIITIFVKEIVKTKQTFVFEGNTDSRVNRTELSKWFKAQGYQPLFVWVQTDIATAKKRSSKQGLSTDDFESIVGGFSAPHISEQPIVLSGKHTYATQAKIVLSRLVTDKTKTSVKAPERPQNRLLIR